MEIPTMFESMTLNRDTEGLVSYLPVPGFGVLPVNSFLIRSSEPVLVDTGLAALEEDYLRALGSLIDPGDIRWIWVTHTDPDHVGNLRRVLELAPQARVVTNYLGMGKLGLLGLPVDRVHLVNPGQSLEVGDRELRAVRPPSFDAPETMGLFDPSSGAYFSADCFGALMDGPHERAEEIETGALSEGMKSWAVVDAPWLHLVDGQSFGRALSNVRALAPETILGSHLPVARDMTATLLQELDAAREMPAFVGPDHEALLTMMASPAA